MGPRLGRVEYGYGSVEPVRRVQASMGPRLGRVEYIRLRGRKFLTPSASMGPRLGRVEYDGHGTTSKNRVMLQWGHA